MIGSDATAYIFDLDGTLYSTLGMDNANHKAITQAVEKHFAVTADEAKRKIETALGTYSKAEGRPSLYGAALSLGVPDQIIERLQRRYVNPKKLLKTDIELADLLSRLASRSKLALLTNTRTSIAMQALEALGIKKDVFIEVWGGDILCSPKPNADEIIRLCAELDVLPSNVVSVGDRWEVDLAPAIKAGLMFRKVSGRDDLVNWLRSIIY